MNESNAEKPRDGSPVSGAATGSTILLAIKVGRRKYQISDRDIFMDNRCCVQLLSQKGPFKGWNHQSIILPAREIRAIAKFHRKEIKHGYGENVSVFSLSNQ